MTAYTRQTLHEGGFAEFGRYSCISQIGATGTFGAMQDGWSGAMWQQQQYVSATKPSTRDFSAGLKGGDRAGLSMDAQKRTKTEWDYEDMCGWEKNSCQLRSCSRFQGGWWEPTISGVVPGSTGAHVERLEMAAHGGPETPV